MKWTALIAAMVLPLAIISAGAESPGDSSMEMAAPMYAELGGYDQARQETAQQMLEMAITAFALDREWAIEQIQDVDNPLYRDGELYVFVLDESGVILFHGATPELVGTDTHTLIDTQGTNLGELFAENRSPYGKWVEYWWPNPATESSDSELKLTWTRTYGEYQFGVGVYPGSADAADLSGLDGQTMRIVRQMTDAAIEAFAADRDSAMAAIQDMDNPLYRDGELYVFVLDESGVILFHGATPELVGTDTHTLIDTQGTNLGELFAENRSPYGKWVEYWWPNPATESSESELKLTWIKTHAGYAFGVGAYPGTDPSPGLTLSAYDEERQGVAWQMTRNAAEAFHADRAGAMAAIQDTNNPLYHDGEIYVSVLDEPGTILAHGTTPELVGVSVHDITDVRGTNIGDLFAKNRSPYGKWVEYWWPNPATETQEPEPKLTLLLERGGYAFATGIYPSTDGQTALDGADPEKRRIAKAMVDRAIEAFAADRDSAMAAIQDMDNPLYRDGELYVFVLDESGVILFHGATPELVGTDTHTLIDTQGTNLGELFAENRSPYGKWVEYWWPNPATESSDSELKLTWLRTSSEYLFGVGMYP